MAAQKRAAPAVPVIGISGEEESEALAAWRAARRIGEAARAELPASLKRGRVDREISLAAEVVRRERPQVSVSIQVAAALDPDRRGKWLARALEAMAVGNSRASDVYDVFSHPRFMKGVSGTVARRMLGEVRKKAALFPERLRQAVLSDEILELARVAAQSPGGKVEGAVHGGSDGAAAEEMLRRCADFVRRNEQRLAEVRDREVRSFEAVLRRDGPEQLWGITWSRVAFGAQRRVLEAVVPDTPAGLWNQAREAEGERPLRPGDELVAVNGRRGWEAMAVIRELLEVSLTFLQAPEASPVASGHPLEVVEEGPRPPPCAEGGYVLDAGSGWRGHMGGQWLFNEAEGVYFHVPSGALFIEDATAAGSLSRLSGTEVLTNDDSNGGPAAGAVPRLLGRVRWFSKAKGFGFIMPWSAEPSVLGAADHSEEDLFVHRSQVLEGLTEHGVSEAPAVPLLPGAPVTYSPAMQEDGQPCAAQVCLEDDVARLCHAGFSCSSSARPVEKAALELKAHGGQAATAVLAGLAAGRRGVGASEFVAQHLARDLAACLRGREQPGERGARVALAAALRQMQHGILQYAQRLSENSANIWLSAETTACVALVFAPESDGRPRALVAVVGGGRGVVGRRDGSVAVRLGGHSGAGGGADAEVAHAGPVGMASLPDEAKGAEDIFKVFEKGLKGPAITFPPIHKMPLAAEAKGFGAHTWSEKDGGAAGLAFAIHSYALDWQEDALLVLGSDSFWEAFSDDEQVVRLALQGCWRPGGDGAGVPADARGGHRCGRAALHVVSAATTTR